MDHDHHGHDHLPVVNATTQIVTMLAEALTSTVAPPALKMLAHDGHEDHMSSTPSDTTGIHGTHGPHAGMDMMHHPMKMYFHVTLGDTILFYDWVPQTVGAMVGAVIGVALLALLYEGLKFIREHLYRHQYSSLTYTTCAVTGNNVQGPAELHKITSNRLLSWPHLLQTVLHVVQVFLSYILMLVFMTFNIWLCLGVLIGSGIGFFLFGWRKATIVDISDHCH